MEQCIHQSVGGAAAPPPVIRPQRPTVIFTPPWFREFAFVCLLHRVDAPLTFGRSSQQEGEIPDTANPSQRIDLMGLIRHPCRFILRKAPLQSGAPGSCRSNFPTPGPSAAPAELSGRSRQIKEMRMGELSVSKLPPNPAGVP